MIVEADDAAIERAAVILREGGLVAFPAETVYGLGADATSGVAVARIFEAKGRPRFNPLIVHVPDVAAVRRFAKFSEMAERLAARFWPGPLTLVLPRATGPHAIGDLVTAGLDTVAIRVPSHPVARRLLERAAVPIAAPSANLSGRVSPTTAAHVLADLGERVGLILDGGPCEAGIESTIVGLSGIPTLLRPGAISREDLEAALGEPLAAVSRPFIQSPGQLDSHYACRAAVRMNAAFARKGELLLAFGPDRGGEAALNLSPSGNLAQAATRLFAYLRALDARGPSAIAVMPIPKDGIGAAINDRLVRASAPR